VCRGFLGNNTDNDADKGDDDDGGGGGGGGGGVGCGGSGVDSNGSLRPLLLPAATAADEAAAASVAFVACGEGYDADRSYDIDDAVGSASALVTVIRVPFLYCHFGSASALVTILCVLCTLRLQIS
jgi:hypothetical protein